MIGKMYESHFCAISSTPLYNPVFHPELSRWPLFPSMHSFPDALRTLDSDSALSTTNVYVFRQRGRSGLLLNQCFSGITFSNPLRTIGRTIGVTEARTIKLAVSHFNLRIGPPSCDTLPSCFKFLSTSCMRPDNTFHFFILLRGIIRTADRWREEDSALCIMPCVSICELTHGMTHCVEICRPPNFSEGHTADRHMNIQLKSSRRP
jgi:hypothetical protein